MICYYQYTCLIYLTMFHTQISFENESFIQVAISFFTGDQAPINYFIDKYYLGWLVRLIFNPLIFFKRFIYALKLLPIVLTNKVKVIGNAK